MHDEKRRILLMYITKVSGHRQATVAIQQSLRQLAPEVEVPAINGFGYTYPLLEKIVGSAYMGVIKSTPKLWDVMYDNPKLYNRTGGIKKFLHKSSHKKIGKLIDRFNPQTIVCTQAFPCGMVADYKITHGLKTKIIGVLTDFAPHSYWINEGIDYYVVPSEDTKEQFVKKGLNPDIIKVFGIPIRPKFAHRLDAKFIAGKMGLDASIPTILIMGGGQGLGPIVKIVKSLLDIERNLQIIVLTGTNQKLYKKLQKISVKPGKKLLAMEYTNSVDELMDLATLIISKPGGMTTSECLAKGLPMVIVDPIPGQEMRNTQFLTRNGIGIFVKDAQNTAKEVNALLNSPEKLEKMSQAAYAQGKPHSALNIAKFVLEQTPQTVLTSPQGNH